MPSKITPPADLWPNNASPPNPSDNGANTLPFPTQSLPVAGTPPPANLPGVDGGQLSSTSVPVPDTSQPSSGSSLPSVDTLPEADLDGFASKAPGVTSEQTVQGQLSELFSNKDVNPLWQHAEGVAKSYANSRGLANSSIAAEAGTQALYANALPIASQDANTFAARAQQEAGFWQSAGLQAQQGTIASQLAAQDHLQQMAQTALQGDINSRLQLEQYGYNFQLSEQENMHNMQLAALQGDIQASLALQNFGFDVELMKQDFGFRLQMQDTELRNALRIGEQQQDHELEQIATGHANTLEQIGANAEANSAINSDTFGRDLQQNYLLAVERRTSQFSTEVQSIYQREGLSGAQQQNAIAVARQNYVNDLDFIQSQYSASSHWQPNWAAGTPQANTGGAGGDTNVPGGPYQPPPPPSIPPPTPNGPPSSIPPSTRADGTPVDERDPRRDR